jgi:hypothetical protein
MPLLGSLTLARFQDQKNFRIDSLGEGEQGAVNGSFLGVSIDRLGHHPQVPDGPFVVIGSRLDRVCAEALGKLFHLPQPFESRRGWWLPARNGVPRNSRLRRRPLGGSVHGGRQELWRQ